MGPFFFLHFLSFRGFLSRAQKHSTPSTSSVFSRSSSSPSSSSTGTMSASSGVLLPTCRAFSLSLSVSRSFDARAGACFFCRVVSRSIFFWIYPNDNESTLLLSRYYTMDLLQRRWGLSGGAFSMFLLLLTQEYFRSFFSRFFASHVILSLGQKRVLLVVFFP